jgi:hypothetical protein
MPEKYVVISIYNVLDLVMNLKKCSKCGKEKILKEFYFRKSGNRSGHPYEKCKECMKRRGRNYYHVNRNRQLKLAISRRGKYRVLMHTYLSEVKNRPCMDCDKRYPSYVMDFDHREGEIKTNEIARMIVGGWSKNKIETEIKKCDLVCANCHKIRTFERNHAGISKFVF